MRSKHEIIALIFLSVIFLPNAPLLKIMKHWPFCNIERSEKSLCFWLTLDIEPRSPRNDMKKNPYNRFFENFSKISLKVQTLNL